MLVDAVASILKTSAAYRNDLRSAKDPSSVPAPDILEWTGPALFSDCVFRYISFFL